MNNLLKIYQKKDAVLLSQWLKAVIAFTLIAVTVGCTVDLPGVSPKTTVVYDQNRNSAYYLGLMQTASGSEKNDLQLMAIRALLAENRLFDAQQQLTQLSGSLNSAQLKEKSLCIAELAVKQQQAFDLSSIDLTTLSDAQKVRYYRLKLLQDKQNHNINGLARDYVVLETIETPATRHNIIDETWVFFNSLSDDELQSIIAYTDETVLQGWIQLSYAYRNSLAVEDVAQVNQEDGSIEMVTPTLSDDERYQRIQGAVSEWQMQFPTHPAALYLPRSIYGNDSQLPINNQGKRVALLLPLQGASKVFGEVLRAGYMEATRFYPEEPGQNIMVFDTSSDSLASLVEQAQQQGAELIVGPLLKNDVAAVTTLGSPIPVLALNKVTGQESSTPALNAKICYFGLSPEDEATDAAAHIFAEGKRTPLIITTQNSVGRRIATAFAEKWNQLYQGNIYVQYFSSADQLKQDMNKGIGLKVQGELLTVPSSQNVAFDAASYGQTALANNEIDAVYVFATKDELEFIKPMLDMKEAEDKSVSRVPPLYTSSRSQSANVSPDYRYEMERVQFSDIPLLVTENPILDQLPKNIQQDYSLARLYAMGIDAWRLANRFEQLQADSQPVMDGLTGKIVVEPGCEIERELNWNIYRRGSIESVVRQNSN